MKQSILAKEHFFATIIAAAFLYYFGQQGHVCCCAHALTSRAHRTWPTKQQDPPKEIQPLRPYFSVSVLRLQSRQTRADFACFSTWVACFLWNQTKPATLSPINLPGHRTNRASPIVYSFTGVCHVIISYK